AVNNPAGFAAQLRRVGDLLARSNADDEEAFAAELDGLIADVRALQPGAPQSVPEAVPIESLAPAPTPAPVGPRAPQPSAARGERALQRARELRGAARRASGDALRALVAEVCDLVALAVEPSPTS